MEYGKSLVQQGRLIHARDLGYDDCRNNQVLCPACSEPVFKVGSLITRRQYLSHYAAKPDSDCELRVMVIVREALNPKVIMPKGQELDRFLSKFEEIIMERGHYPRDMVDLLSGMQKRQTYRRFINFCARLTRDVCLGGIGTDGKLIEGYADMELWKEHHSEEFRDCMRTTFAYLNSPNSFRVRLFAASFGMIQTMLLIKNIPSAFKPGKFKDNNHYLEMCCLTDYDFKQFVRETTKAGKLGELVLEVGMAIATTGATFTMFICNSE